MELEKVTRPSAGKKNRRWSQSDKKDIVFETYKEGQTVSGVARKYNISVSQLFNWRRLAKEGKEIEDISIAADKSNFPSLELQSLRERVANLERMLGRKTEQVELLLDKIKVAK